MTVIAKLYFPCSPNLGLSGLKADPDACITVTFHCIVPKLLWEWDEESHIHMRFEGDALGCWKENVGEFVEVRCVPVFVHILCIKLKLLYEATYHQCPEVHFNFICTYFPESKVICAHRACHGSLQALLSGILLLF